MRLEEEFTKGHDELKHGARGGKRRWSSAARLHRGDGVRAWTEEKKRQGCQGERGEAVIHVS